MIGALIVYIFAVFCELMLEMFKVMWYMITLPYQLFKKPQKNKKGVSLISGCFKKRKRIKKAYPKGYVTLNGVVYRLKSVCSSIFYWRYI